jgi:hypothetical protein
VSILVELPLSFTDGIAVAHLKPQVAEDARSRSAVPILLGYADAAGQSYRDGSGHTPPTLTSTETGAVDVDSVGVP